jgi:hypothetical protein
MEGVSQDQDVARRRFLAGAGIAAAAATMPLLTRSSLEPKSGSAALPASLAFGAGPDIDRPRLFPRAMDALDRHAGIVLHRDRIGVVDFSEPSRQARMHIVDVASGDARSYLVAHGKGSDPARSGWLQGFSNVPDSEASSRGAYLTGEAYVGQHGRSRRLVGLDPDNDLAEARAIVIHAAAYVSDGMARAQGLIGRSQGCFAVAESAIDEVLERLGAGRLLFAWK